MLREEQLEEAIKEGAYDSWRALPHKMDQLRFVCERGVNEEVCK